MNEQVGAREFANVAYGGAGVWKSVGVGKSGSFRASLSELFTAIAKEAKQSLDQFNAQNLANTAWALTDSAACTLGSCRSVALWGGADWDGS